jgi:transcriptional regulator of acetoin/glycerol metabolism
LENAIIYAVNICEGGIILPQDLPQEITDGVDLPLPTTMNATSEAARPDTNLSMKDIERIMIAQTLDQTNHNISEAALLLDMSRSTLYRKIKEYQLIKN